MRKTEWKSNLIDKINTAALIAFDLQQGRKRSKYLPQSLVKFARNVPLHIENDRNPNFCYLPKLNILLKLNYYAKSRIAEYRRVPTQ